MRGEPQPEKRGSRISAGRDSADTHSTDSESADYSGAKFSDSDRRYRVALLLYVALAVLAWFTMGEDKILVGGRPVELRLIPLVILGGVFLRTVLARYAEKIRRGGDKAGGQPVRICKKG